MAKRKSAKMKALEASYGKPIETIIRDLMNERPQLDWLQMARRLGVGERTFREWRSRFGGRREVTWTMPEAGE